MLENCARVDPPSAGSEKQMLEAFLDWQRATLLCKLDGLSDEELRRPGTPSGVSLLGIVKHLADVERGWFREVFANEDLAHFWDPEDPDAYWRIEPHETTTEILAFYRDEVARCREVIRHAEPEDVARKRQMDMPLEPPGLTLRWIMLHMIEETARHNGHADILHEAIDGQTGE